MSVSSDSRRVLALVLLLALPWLGCGARPAPSAESPESPRRIIALAPSSVELLFALGVGDRVVGVGDYCTFPPEVGLLPRLGGLVDPHLEAILGLSPDLVVVLPSEDTLGRHLASLGLPTLTVDSNSLADVEKAVSTLASRLGVEAAGEALVSRLRRDLAPVTASERPRVLVSLEREPGRPAEILTAGPGSFVDELLTRAGAANLFADAAGPFPKVGLEAVLSRDPEVILEFAIAEDPERDQRLLADWQAYPMLQAVARGRVRVIAGSHTVVPGPRLVELYADIRRALELAREPS